eukprot:TRINITY_DN5583_c0_g1_i7.p3 TRINITY_DN5583_c0_g1~~TRINITY_DN5583_c0_g1_i7.p3  ORF type:complete len:119 (-),score=27.00 TRINITY_DN5583_c0_g1_i7:334-690(-)
MERTDMVASRFGLKRVGWIFTQLGVSHKDRHKYKPPHTAQELWNVARIQNLFRSEWNNSTNSGGSAGGGGFFGSKFVNIIVTEKEIPQSHFVYHVFLWKVVFELDDEGCGHDISIHSR